MSICGNPECQNEIPADRTHCDQDCFDRDYQLRKQARGETNLAHIDDIWLGQTRRKRAMDIITKLAKEMCPTSHSNFVSIVSYRTGLSRRKIAEDYLVVLRDVGIVRVDRGTLYVTNNFSEGEIDD